MNDRRKNRQGFDRMLAALMVLVTGPNALASQQGAAVVVEGRVLGTYQRATDDEKDVLVELEARRSELGDLPLGNTRVEIPSPGDLV